MWTKEKLQERKRCEREKDRNKTETNNLIKK